MFVDLDWPLNASSLLSASAELLVTSEVLGIEHVWTTCPGSLAARQGSGRESNSQPFYIASPVPQPQRCRATLMTAVLLSLRHFLSSKWNNASDLCYFAVVELKTDTNLYSGRDLFRKLCSSEHSLHHLLPPERMYSNLRNRGHPYELPEYCTNLHKKSFYYSIIVFVHLIF